MGDKSDSDDDVPQLSARALAALQEFYSEETQRRTKNEEDTKKFGGLDENWGFSQFWYDEATADTLAKEVLDASGPNGRIACVSCPTLYQKLQEVQPKSCSSVILEYDKRFQIYGDNFIFYDFNKPMELPMSLEEHSFDIVIGDPPYLNEHCLGETAKTLKYLTKGKILLCTGAVMKGVAKEILNADMCNFKPTHTNNLANEFRCYANYQTKFLNEDR